MTPADAPDTTTTDLAIVGSGFSGLGMAIRLKQSGRTDFIVFERADDVGGTWHYNTYPGCGCDVPSHLYSFSFAPNPGWSRTYSSQPEIRDYLRRCADEFEVRSHVRFGHTVLSAEWDEAERRWQIETDQGPFTARVLVSGMGPLTEPRTPELPGLDSFEGTSFHSARWNHDHDLHGRRVASIGTGASAVQYVPSIQPQVERLHVFQRTAPWIMPHTDRPIRDWERRLFDRVPAAQRAVRAAVYAAREALVPGLVKQPKLMRGLETVGRAHMRRQVSDPHLLEKVTPDYTVGCKRILPSDRWYPALGEPNVELVTDPIREVRPRSIVTEDGSEREVDTIVFGTGFRVTDIPVGQQIRGRGGQLLDDVWQGSPQAHLGTSIAGFPNLFLLLGPNTGLGHNSMVYMAESQIAYVMDALRTMAERGVETVEVREDVQEDFNRYLDERMEPSVWNTGCSSWYRDSTGRISTLWPSWTWRFRRRTAQFDPSQYVARTLRAPELVAA